MVKLQKHKAYTYETEEGKKIAHYKHLVVIPEETIQELGWRNGVELEINIRTNSLTLKPTVSHGEKNEDD